MFGSMDITLLLPALIFSLYAQHKVRSAFKEMSRVRSTSGMTGAEVAKRMLERNGLGSVQVELIAGDLSDHYDPIQKTLRLSSPVYQSDSLAALGVAAHETGHALQHRDAYRPLQVRQAIFPVVKFGSSLWMPLFIGGLLFSIPNLIDLGIVLFSAAVAFHLVTLPVEFNASKRALAQLSSGGYISEREIAGAKKVLDAAAMTYVAAAAMAALQLLRLLLLRRSD